MTTEAVSGIRSTDLGELLLYLADNGFADQVGSWVSDVTENQPITGAQLLSVLNAEGVAEAAAEAGVSVQEYADQLAQELSGATDAVTPHGELPDDTEFEQRLRGFYSA
ncbi:YidB family protein [Streptomyces sp. NPDC012473]|uniref:YidB family protein n=1 Tax=Streptomyces sp. NPDC012473 TaxID=3156676 RepID=UPI0033F46355